MYMTTSRHRLYGVLLNYLLMVCIFVNFLIMYHTMYLHSLYILLLKYIHVISHSSSKMSLFHSDSTPGRIVANN